MSHHLKWLAAAGTLGVGVATLALVGTGTFAGYTAQVHDDTSITSGTFTLAVIHPLTDPVDANVVTDPTLYLEESDAPPTLTSGNTNTVTFTQTTVDPSAKSVFQFTVYDTGSIPGIVDHLAYTPTTSANTLMDYARITVEECVHNDGTCQAVRSTLTKTTGWVPMTDVGYPASATVPPPPFAATGSYTFDAKSSTGNGLNGFLNPGDTLSGGTGPTGLNTHGHGTGWITYRVILTFTPAIPNGAQGQSFSFSLTPKGTNT
jgi:predicted ribosomally synthesized peptide with SipW-like signal peptide